MKKFALIGAAGYVAPKHIQAIKDVGGELVAILDPHDSVGMIDRYFPNCKYFSELERFWRQLDKWSDDIDYVSVCSPNYLHDAHCMIGMSIGADIICEKPLVINPKNIERLQRLEEKFDKKIYNVLQLRYHPKILQYKENMIGGTKRIKINYNTPRGDWYSRTWKGDEKKSGGILYNIGIHLFDSMNFLFGEYVYGELESYEENKKATGKLMLENATVDWSLSIDKDNEPQRDIIIDGVMLDLNGSFTDLHTTVYKEILNDNGYGIEDVKSSISLIHEMKEKYEILCT